MTLQRRGGTPGLQEERRESSEEGEEDILVLEVGRE